MFHLTPSKELTYKRSERYADNAEQEAWNDVVTFHFASSHFPIVRRKASARWVAVAWSKFQ